jgi:alkyl sulfatase BDS1-like metallo-beta-lactamase superfamily hydrolase
MSQLPFEDRTDFENADRGFLGRLEPGVITGEDGHIVFDSDTWSFLDVEAPDTAHPSLWRQAQLTAKQGLYEVTEGIYQVRGLDLSNMTLIEGDRGVVVIDPLTTVEAATAALALYRTHRGDRPVTGVIHTHSHVDHFGGVLGVVSADDDVPRYAPEGFLDHSVAENVYAGTAMFRRGMYYAGMFLDANPTGTLGMGLGPGPSAGYSSLLPPTHEITHTGQEESLDGVRIIFQLTPNTEAPSEMNFFFPDHRALCMAENASHVLHNILTLRGAVVRDSRIWSRYLNEAIQMFADGADVAFGSHHWPTWGTEDIKAFLRIQRDLYAYLHDQTLRLINLGYTGSEIAEELDGNMPPGLERAWSTHGYYGSVSHNVKAIYQFYMGWYDGNPAHLWQHPPSDAGRRYVDCMGGPDAVVDRARSYLDQGDLRFAAELLSHVVFADETHVGARELLASTFERLAYGCENATWRNCYLTGAFELRSGVPDVKLTVGGMTGALTVTQILDAIAIRVNGPKAWSEQFVIDWHITDLDENYRAELSNGVLIHYPDPSDSQADLTLTLTKEQLLGLTSGQGLDGIGQDGDLGVLQRLMSYLDEPDPNFAIVTP